MGVIGGGVIDWVTTGDEAVGLVIAVGSGEAIDRL